MKYLPLLLTLIPTLVFSKTRLNDYYVGFEIATVDHDTIDGELFDLSANMPLEGANLHFNLTFGDLDNNGTQFDIGADYLHHFNNFDGFDLIISVLSSLSNSGITLLNDDNNLSLYFLLLTIIGGSLISNTSGIKLSRFYILLKVTSAEIIKLISPNSVINKTIFNSDNKINEEKIKISFLIFISFFFSLFVLSSLLILDNIGFEGSFKLSILTLTNTVNSEMYSLQNLNFANLLTSSKISLIIFMIIGKIELVSIFLIIKKIIFKD